MRGTASARNLTAAASDTIRAAGGLYGRYYRQESRKDDRQEKPSISVPGLKGSEQKVVFGKGSGKKGRGGRKSAETMATGGRRNTSITMNISKFFDSINVYMNDRTDTAELERTIVRTMNRALAIATSTER